MPKERYYKGKYLIAVYDEDDYPFCVVSSVRELAEVTGKKLSTLKVSLSKQCNEIILFGKAYMIYLIPMEEEEMEKIQVKLTINEIDIISHLIENEIIVNNHSIVLLQPRDKEISAQQAIQIINNQNGQLTDLQTKFKKIKEAC